MHSIATDSQGNIYTTETYEGKRVQKFVYPGARAHSGRGSGAGVAGAEHAVARRGDDAKPDYSARNVRFHRSTPRERIAREYQNCRIAITRISAVTVMVAVLSSAREVPAASS